MPSKQHWEHVYATKPTDGVSWYQEQATLSLRLIAEAGLSPHDAVIDVGGGASRLVDELLAKGCTALTVLDLSGTALAKSRARLGVNAAWVRWLEGDITEVRLAPECYALWHDRAVFHFLTAREEREAYVWQVLYSLVPGGHVILATFAEDGPPQCSGLPVERYCPETLRAELGDAFELLGHYPENHVTPFGTTQPFLYCHFRKRVVSSSPHG